MEEGVWSRQSKRRVIYVLAPVFGAAQRADCDLWPAEE
jgi:hypothetical protein